MIICITGATGFIGGKLVRAHLMLGNEVRYLTRANSKCIVGAQAFVCDINASVDQLLPFFENVDIFYHCAGELINEAVMHSTHVQGTANLLSLIEKIRLKKQISFHWIQLSSCGAYGQTSSQQSIERYVDENDLDSPIGEYEHTKTESDKLIINFAAQYDWFKYTIIRPTIVFGSGMRSTAILRIAKMINNRLFFYVGNKDSIANYVHVDDVVKAMLLSVNQQKAHNQLFIVSNDCKFSDLIDTIANALNASKPSWVVNEFLLRKAVSATGRWIKLPISNAQIDVMVRQTHYSNDKIKKMLNWKPSAPVLSQLREYVHSNFDVKNV